MQESLGSVVRVAVETSEVQIEVDLVPTVEVMNCWPKRARWPRLLQRWPSTECTRCIKVKSMLYIQEKMYVHGFYDFMQGFSHLSLAVH